MKPNDLLCRSFASGALVLPGDRLAWDDLIRSASDELVLPSLYSRFQELNVLSQLPVEVSDFLSSVAQLNLARNQAILADLATVVSRLKLVGIEPVLLKGAAYCVTGVYTNLAARYLWDVDLLVPIAQLALAVDILAQDGFTPDQSYQLGYFRHHYPPLGRKGSVHFELHHSLGMGVCERLLPASEVLEHAVCFDLQGMRVRVPSPEHLMTHLIMHSQNQHPYNERIWPPIRALYDLVLMRRRFDTQLDWTAIQHRFNKAGQSDVLALHLLRARDVLGLEPPFPIPLRGLTRLRWLRRELLRKLPFLRFFDPLYMYSTLLVRRLRLLRSALGTPGGWKQIARELFTPALYKRFLADVLEGRGR
jgi:hypothetical protein